MSDEEEVLQSARKFASQFSGFMKAAEIIGRTATLGAAADEVQARLDALKGKEAELLGKHADATRIKAEAESVLKAAEGQAKAKLAAAEASAAQIRQDAADHAAELRDQAARAKSDIIAQGHAAADRLRAETETALAGLRGQVAEHSDRLGNLKTDVADKLSQRDQINAALAALKAKIG
jgi:chromosome segregation ATPase